MPEFDIPGHSRSALACYNYLGCFERNLPVADHWGVKHDVLCAGKESTYEFVEDIVDELCELFRISISYRRRRGAETQMASLPALSGNDEEAWLK